MVTLKNLEAHTLGIARERSKHYPPFERARFLNAFKHGVKAGELGADTWRIVEDHGDDSVFVAGFIEGIASTRQATETEYGVKRS